MLIPILVGQFITAQEVVRTCKEATHFFDLDQHENLEKWTKEWEHNKGEIAISRGKITIPVVVHIVFQSAAENISDEQIKSQIDALNRDFNLQNNNLGRIHPDFKDRIANVGFNFCLARVDPNGLATTGITRRATQEDFIFNRNNWIYYTQEGGQDAWDTSKYLNIWVTKSTVLGYGSKPFENPSTEDGIVVGANYFGTIGTVSPPFHLGRTATHEVGHYFNIFHPWKNVCGFDDFVADTPEQSNSYNGCPDSDASSCGSRDITANFMNLSDDECLAMFTVGQAKRMQAALFFVRSGLLETEQNCNQPSVVPVAEQIHIYPNPANYYFCIETKELGQESINFRMINSKGEIIQEIEGLPENHNQIIQTQPEGVYFLQFFINEKESILKKLIIKR